MLKKEYFRCFQHSLQVDNSDYVVLLICSNFYHKEDIRPSQISQPPVQEMKSEDTANLNLFTSQEKQEYEKKVEHERASARQESKPPPLITPRTSRVNSTSLFLERQKNFLERRNSKIYVPNLNSAREHSISENS